MDKGMKYYDVTLPFRERMATYPGDPGVRFREHYSISRGDPVNVTELVFGSHTGTHIDAPRHFIEGGLAVDQLPLEHFIGKAKVFEIHSRDEIRSEDLVGLDIDEGDIILLKTLNSFVVRDDEFHTDYVYVTPGAAQFLVDRGIRTLGFDYLSVEKFGGGSLETHLTLLRSNVVIIEGLDLSEVKQGVYDMISLPMKIEGGNGSPIRVVLAGKT